MDGWTKVVEWKERERQADREGGGKGTTMRIYVICVYDLNNCLHNITWWLECARAGDALHHGALIKITYVCCL